MIRMRKAVASRAKPLVGLYARSGAGKTFSALLLAHGFTGGDMSRVAMLETEAGRGEAFASHKVVGGYNVFELAKPFSPTRYGELIADAEAEHVEVLIIDSASHEWDGIGGVRDMADKNREDGKKGPLVWQKPKIDHETQFMGRLMQSPIPLVIVCMRAKYPMYEVTARDVERWEAAGRPGGDKAKPKVGDWARAWELEPKQSEDILFEMFVHGWIDAEHRFHLTKETVEEMREIFRDGEPITTDTGKRLASWSKARNPESGEPITADHKRILESTALERGVSVERLCAKARVKALADLPESEYQRALDWLHKVPGDSARA